MTPYAKLQTSHSDDTQHVYNNSYEIKMYDSLILEICNAHYFVEDLTLLKHNVGLNPT